MFDLWKKGSLAVLFVTALSQGLANPVNPPGQPQKPKENQGQLTDPYGDPLPPGAIARMGTTRFREPGCCQLVNYSPDGRLLASGGPNGIIIWEAATGKRTAFFQGRPTQEFDPTQPNRILAVECLTFSPDGRYLAAGFNYGEVHVWEVETGKLHLPLWELYAQLDFVAFTPDSRSVFAGSSREIRLCEVTSGRELGRWNAAGNEQQGRDELRRGPAFGAKAVSGDGKILAALTYDKTQRESALRIWDLARGEERPRLEGMAGAIAFGPDNTTLAIVRAEPDEIILVDAQKGKEIRSWKWRRDPLHSNGLAFAPDGKTLAAKGWLWDFTTGTALRRIGDYKGAITDVSFSPDGTALAVGTDRSQIVELLEVVTGKQMRSLEAHRGCVGRALAYAPDGRTLASGADCSIRLWDALTGKPLQRLGKESHFFSKLAFSPDGRILASAGHHIVVWDVETGEELLTMTGHDAFVTCIVFSPSGENLVSGGTDMTIRLWDVRTGKELRQYGPHQMPVSAAVFSPNGNFIASSGDRGTVWLWDVKTGKPLRRLETLLTDMPHSPSYCLAFSPEGDILASVNDHDCAIHFWNVNNGKKLGEIRGHVNERHPNLVYRISSLSFSPDGKSLATTGYDATIRVWEVLTGYERIRWPEAAEIAVFSPGRRTLASAGEATAALVWDLTRRSSDGNIRPLHLELKELAALWEDLASEDGVRAYEAVWTLVAASEQAPTFTKERVQAISRPNSTHLQRLVDELDSDSFNIREQASRELERFGEAAKVALVRAQQDQISADQRNRIEHLLAKLEKPLPRERIRILRAIEMLECVASPEARAVLEKLAAGAPGVTETEAARRALQRLRKNASN